MSRLLPTYDEVDRVTARDAERTGVTCVKGCNHCCSQLVGVTGFEVEEIVDYLYQNHADKIQGTVKRLSAHVASLLAMAGDMPAIFAREEWWNTRTECVLLRRGLCLVYPVRPLACRMYMVNSDPHDCARREGGGVRQIASTRDGERLDEKLTRALVQDMADEGASPRMGTLQELLLDGLLARADGGAYPWSAPPMAA